MGDLHRTESCHGLAPRATNDALALSGDLGLVVAREGQSDAGAREHRARVAHVRHRQRPTRHQQRHERRAARPRRPAAAAKVVVHESHGLRELLRDLPRLVAVRRVVHVLGNVLQPTRQLICCPFAAIPPTVAVQDRKDPELRREQLCHDGVLHVEAPPAQARVRRSCDHALRVEQRRLRRLSSAALPVHFFLLLSCAGRRRPAAMQRRGFCAVSLALRHLPPLFGMVYHFLWWRLLWYSVCLRQCPPATASLVVV
jgi:hypothetical protein